MKLSRIILPAAWAVLAAVVASGCSGSSSNKEPADWNIDNFGCDKTEGIGPLPSACTWQISGDAPISCSILADGVALDAVDDCAAEGKRVLLLPGGTKKVTFVTKDRSGKEKRVEVGVNILAAPPRITAVSYSSNGDRVPADIRFGWTIQDPENRPLRCEMDYDADGTFDEAIDNCTSADKLSHTYVEEGEYRATLRVTNTGGASDERSTTVRLGAHHPPRIDEFLATPAVGDEPMRMKFTWKIDDLNGDAMVCRVDAGNDGSWDGVINDCTSDDSFEHTFSKPGTYPVRLQVADAFGLMTTQQIDVPVEHNEKPVISSFSGSPEVGPWPLAVSFSWTVADPDGDALACALDVDADGVIELQLDHCRSPAELLIRGEGNHPVRLIVQDARGLVSTSEITIVALPRITVGDMELVKVEWGQSVIAEQLPLVSGKEALLVATVLGSEPNIQNVTVRADFSLAGQPIGSVPLSGPAAPPTSVSNFNLSDRWTGMVPGEFFVPGVRIRIAVDPDDMLGEDDEGNNEEIYHPKVLSERPLPLTAVPIVFKGKTGQIVDAEERLTQLWPLTGVSSTNRASYTYDSQNLNWEQLLDELAAVRLADGSRRYYLGYVPNTPSSGTAGIGFVGEAVALTKDDSPSTPSIIAHELGHNFGLPHAPCGVPSADPHYPFSDAKIGSFGWDWVTHMLRSPAIFVDVMSYCDPQWVSEYNYRKVTDFLERRPPSESFVAMEDAEVALLVRGTIRSDGEVTLAPIHRIRAVPTDVAAEHRLVLHGVDDSSSAPVELLPTDHGDPDTRHFVAVMKDPGELMGITLQFGAATLWETTVPPQAPAEAPKVREEGGRLHLNWNASTHPWAALAHIDAEGRRTTLALALRDGQSEVSLQGVAPGGSFEISLSSGLEASRFVIER